MTINHEQMTDAEVTEAIKLYEFELGIPVTDALTRPPERLSRWCYARSPSSTGSHARQPHSPDCCGRNAKEPKCLGTSRFASAIPRPPATPRPSEPRSSSVVSKRRVRIAPYNSVRVEASQLSAEYKHLRRLWDAVSGWKTAEFLIDGRPSEFHDLYTLVRYVECADKRDVSPQPSRYCEKSHAGGQGWGCRYLSAIEREPVFPRYGFGGPRQAGGTSAASTRISTSSSARITSARLSGRRLIVPGSRSVRSTTFSACPPR